MRSPDVLLQMIGNAELASGGPLGALERAELEADLETMRRELVSDGHPTGPELFALWLESAAEEGLAMARVGEWDGLTRSRRLAWDRLAMRLAGGQR